MENDQYRIWLRVGSRGCGLDAEDAWRPFNLTEWKGANPLFSPGVITDADVPPDVVSIETEAKILTRRPFKLSTPFLFFFYLLPFLLPSSSSSWGTFNPTTFNNSSFLCPPLTDVSSFVQTCNVCRVSWN